MDVPRKSAAKKRLIKRIIYGTITIVAAVAITLGVSKLKPAARTVEGNTVLTDSVKRGSMLRQVRGTGTLVPEEIRWIPATTQGRVERLVMKVGETVQPESIIIELSNPEVEQDFIDAESQLKSADADYTSLRVQLERRLLDQRAAAATVQSDYSQAKLEADVNEGLAQQGLIPDVRMKQLRVRADELATRNEIEQKRLSISSEETRAQLAAQQARIDQLRAMVSLRRSQVDSLKVRASIAGVLQQVEVQVGQQVTPGSNLARVTNPTKLKAELRIAETQVRDVALGQKVSIDTRNGIIPGRVSRIDPAAQNGTVTVDAELEGELPKGARPDLSVDGTIELERLDNILYVGRPVHGQERSTVGLFRVEPDGTTAVRVKVQLGRSSVTTIEILEGLREGDKVILSDTSGWDDSDVIRLN